MEPAASRAERRRAGQLDFDESRVLALLSAGDAPPGASLYDDRSWTLSNVLLMGIYAAMFSFDFWAG
jgi:hypothetical protein